MREPGHQPPDRAGELSHRELVNGPYDESLHYEAMNDRDCTADNPGHYQRGVVQIHDECFKSCAPTAKSLVLMRDARSSSKHPFAADDLSFISRPPTQLVVQSSA